MIENIFRARRQISLVILSENGQTNLSCLLESISFLMILGGGRLEIYSPIISEISRQSLSETAGQQSAM